MNFFACLVFFAAKRFLFVPFFLPFFILHSGRERCRPSLTIYLLEFESYPDQISLSEARERSAIFPSSVSHSVTFCLPCGHVPLPGGLPGKFLRAAFAFHMILSLTSDLGSFPLQRYRVDGTLSQPLQTSSIGKLFSMVFFSTLLAISAF